MSMLSSSRSLTIRLLVLLLPLFALAADTVTSSPTAPSATSTDSSTSTSTASYNVFSAIASDTPGDGSYHLSPGSVGNQDNSTSSSNADGASGGSGGLQLSSGAQAAIFVVVAIVALLGIAIALFFIIAKSRRWDIRDTIYTSRHRRKFTVIHKKNRPGPPPPYTRSDADGSFGLRSTSAMGQRYTTPLPMALKLSAQARNSIGPGSAVPSPGHSPPWPQSGGSIEVKELGRSSNSMDDGISMAPPRPVYQSHSARVSRDEGFPPAQFMKQQSGRR